MQCSESDIYIATIEFISRLKIPWRVNEFEYIAIVYVHCCLENFSPSLDSHAIIDRGTPQSGLRNLKTRSNLKALLLPCRVAIPSISTLASKFLYHFTEGISEATSMTQIAEIKINQIQALLQCLTTVAKNQDTGLSMLRQREPNAKARVISIV